MMTCLYLDSTVASEAEEALTEMRDLYALDVESDLQHKFRMNSVDQLRIVRADWLRDLTGTKGYPQTSVYYDSDAPAGDSGRPTIYTLQALQHEMYFRLRSNFGRLLGNSLKVQVMNQAPVLSSRQILCK